MADPSLVPEASDIAKVGGGLGVGGVITFLLQRLSKNEDKVLERLEGLHRELGEVKTQLAVLVNAHHGVDTTIKQLQAQVNGHGRTISRLEVAIAKLGVKVDSSDGS